MSIITGIVQSIDSKDWNAKKMWSIKVGNARYGTADTRPACQVGDDVSFEIVKRGEYWNVQGRITVLNSAGVSAPPAGALPAPLKQKDWDETNRSIQYQSSRKDALSVVGILMSSEAVAKPAKAADRAKVVLALVDELTDRYYSDVVTFVAQGTRDSGAAAGSDTEDTGGDPYNDDIPF